VKGEIYFGIRTVSTTWMTPFDCITSAIVTVDMPPLPSTSSILPAFSSAVRLPP
jgi:hypothetical protein